MFIYFSPVRSRRTDSGAALNPGLLPGPLVAKQQVMSWRVSESNIRNGCLNVGCVQFKMDLILDGGVAGGSGVVLQMAVRSKRCESSPCIDSLEKEKATRPYVVHVISFHISF